MSETFDRLRDKMSDAAREEAGMIAKVELAKLFALEKHGDQMYRKHPYMYHLSGVVQNIESFVLSDEMRHRCLTIAWLHDTLEDTNTSMDELREGFGEEIALAVYWLSKPKGMLYDKYLTRLIEHSTDEIMIVKLADLEFNIKESGEWMKTNSKVKHMHEKYLLARMMLQDYSNYKMRK